MNERRLGARRLRCGTQAIARFAAAGLMALASTTAPAQTDAAGSARKALEDFVTSRLGTGYRAELTVGQLDPRMKLAPCTRIEPYLLPGTRLWGRTSIGVRCVEGAQWAVALPLQVRVYGPALVAVTPIPAGSRVDAGLVRIAQVELSAEAAMPLASTDELDGRVTTRTLAVGQAIRPYHLRVLPTINAGDPVRIRVIGAGFAISADGSALSAAGEGQSLRVRTTSGRVLLGTVNGRTVEVKL